MPVAAVLGWPLAHTLSPALHQAAYRAAGLDGWSYEARPTRPEDLAAALEEVRAGRLGGVNLTTPHKQPAAALVDALEGPADRLGAVNTVFVGEGRLVGANTDVAGAVWALGSQLGLRDHRWPGTGPAVLLGTGGVALAVAFAWSRLAIDKRLEIDATVQYAVGHSRLSARDLRSSSPYNTYVHAGLPPTPIAAPGEAAIRAALQPADGDWTYYVLASKDGEHAFTDSYQEFLRLKAQAKAKGLL